MDSPTGPSTSEELQQEVRRLRSEIQQLREIVNALFNAVFEDQGEYEPSGHGDEHHMYN